MRKTLLLWGLVVLPFILHAQDSYILEVYDLEVVYDDQKLEPENAYKVIITENKEKELKIYGDEKFSYEVNFKLKRNKNKVKVIRKGKLTVENENTCKGKNHKDVSFINPDNNWEINGMTSELLVYDKRDIRSFFISYEYRVRPKQMLGFR